MPRPRDDEEADAPGTAIKPFPGQKHVKPRSARPEAVEQERERQEPLGCEAEPHQPAEHPCARVQDLELMPGSETDAANLLIASWKQVEIGDVAIPEQAKSQFRVANGVGILPAEHTC